MKANFSKAINFILRWEGGYTEDPSDPGRATNYGISSRYHPNLDVKNLTVEQAQDIYYREYWLPAGCDALLWPMDMIVFDTAVNLGVQQALRLLDGPGPYQDYLLDRIAAYVARVKANPVKIKYLRGWINRVLDLRREIG